MSYVTKNYATADKTVIGGELAITTAGKITKNGVTMNLAEKMPTQANSTATDVAGVVADLNSLLAKLKSAGLMS